MTQLVLCSLCKQNNSTKILPDFIQQSQNKCSEDTAAVNIAFSLSSSSMEWWSSAGLLWEAFGVCESLWVPVECVHLEGLADRAQDLEATCDLEQTVEAGWDAQGSLTWHCSL